MFDVEVDSVKCIGVPEFVKTLVEEDVVDLFAVACAVPVKPLGLGRIRLERWQIPFLGFLILFAVVLEAVRWCAGFVPYS